MSHVTMGEGPLREELAYVDMEEGRLQEEFDATTTTTTTTASSTIAATTIIATTTPPRTDSYGFLPSDESKSIKDELMELFFEVMDFNRQRNWKKKVLAVCMGVCTVFVVVDLIFLGNIMYIIRKFAAWMSLHIFPGTLLFIGLLTCCTLIMIPPSILMFVCGYVFAQVCGLVTGIPAAVLVSFAGCAVGAILAFLRARYMMRDLFQLFSKRYKIIGAVDRAIKHHGFRVMVLLRLCPIIPFNGLNYFGGVTSISMEHYVFALVGTLPLIILTVVAGAGAESLVADQDMTADEYAIRRVQIVVGLLFILVAVIITLFKAKKELVRELAVEQEELVRELASEQAERAGLPAPDVLPVEVHSMVPVSLDVKAQNKFPPSQERSATREPKQTERRSLLQSGRRDFRSKLATRKPEFLRSSSMPNVMARGRKQRRPRTSLTASKEPCLHEVLDWTSMSDSEHIKLRSSIGRASSARDVTANTRNQKSHRALVMEKKQTSERTLLGASSRHSSKAKSVDDAQMLLMQGWHANPALNERTVTIAKFLEDDSRNRIKPCSVEAADATSMKAVSSPVVHKWKVVPTTAHATRRPVIPENASCQRFVVQSSDPLSGNTTSTPSRSLSSKTKRPVYQTLKSESVLGVLC
jgi:uncharacterized membrane protein YdjX (TVP38/TMEM64 family)